jgi:threonine aldolase
MSQQIIDLRSDTVTQPVEAMREAMAAAVVGDDDYGEDPTVNQLEKMAADLLGFENAVFVSSGTQSNLLAMMTQCVRGDEYIVGEKAHMHVREGGAAILGHIQPRPLACEADGTLSLEKIFEMINPSAFNYLETKLFCLENTQDGHTLPLDYFPKARKFADNLGLKLHLDGARLFNAAVKLKVPAREISQHFDTVSICLSKGLGAPVGSLLCSSNNITSDARHWRKLLGGGMRQAGVLAAAGIYALENHVERLEEDHQLAQALAAGLSEISGLEIEYTDTQTNMVFLKLSTEQVKTLPPYLKEKGILVHPEEELRLVTHLDVNKDDIDKTIEVFKGFFA